MNTIQSMGRHLGKLELQIQALERTKPYTSDEPRTKHLSPTISAGEKSITVAQTDSDKPTQVEGPTQHVQNLVQGNKPSLAGLLTSLYDELESMHDASYDKRLKEQLQHLSSYQVNTSLKEEEIPSQLKTILQALGADFDLEMRSDKRADQESASLKTLLTTLLEENNQPHIKEKAEVLLERLNGMKLAGTESGPIQQFIMQYPFAIDAKQMDLTVQWEGRKQEDGSIDPNYCRMLFYLQLEHLDEVTVHILVQNRIMSINVVNSHPLVKEIAEPLLAQFKNKLNELDYKISSIVFKDSLLPLGIGMKETKEVPKRECGYSGLDVRI